jgi:ABC-type Zn uptake system ZnuABC Zn-binding protein ZnuA
MGPAMRRLGALVVIGVALGVPARAATLKVVATTEDLASLTREVGGDRVQVEALAKGYQDPHFVEAKPSFVLKLHAADLLVAVGREMEIGWLPALVNQSRNAKIQVGAAGYLDASLTARILEIPQGQITRAMGDVHPFGNPHYWLDPGNGRRVAQAIQAKLTELSPGDAAHFASRYADFDKRLAAGEARWEAVMAPYRGLKVVTYHRSWPNFCERFGLDVVGDVEPRPGIPPSPSHIIALIQEMKRLGIKIVLVEPYFDLRTPKSVARETGARIVVMPPSVGGEKEITDYVALFDHNVRLLVDAITETGAR